MVQDVVLVAVHDQDDQTNECDYVKEANKNDGP